MKLKFLYKMIDSILFLYIIPILFMIVNRLYYRLDKTQHLNAFVQPVAIKIINQFVDLMTTTNYDYVNLYRR